MKLNLKDNAGDAGKVQVFLNHLHDFLLQGILDQDEADELLSVGNMLLLGITRG
ncbi:MAG: hypothetical protein L0211_13020 [Planctomycetaceae bacterium]|nr:hypothetical protein [Planctomycetaceae bacterium]